MKAFDEEPSVRRYRNVLFEVLDAETFEINDFVVFYDHEGGAGYAKFFPLVVNGLLDSCERRAVICRRGGRFDGGGLLGQNWRRQQQSR